MVKEIKNNIALIAVFVLSFAMPAFATYTPPVGNNNDVQYKNGFGFAGSDNFVVNGTNIGIGTFQPFALFSIGTNNGTGVLGSPGGFQVDSKGSLTMYGDDGTAYFLGNVHTHEIGTDYNIFDDGDGNVNLAGVLNVNSSNNNISPEFAVNDFNDSIALQVNDDDSGKGDYVQTLNNVIDDGNGNVGIGTVHPNNSLIVAIGNVGIGTAFPGQKLDVQGTVRATSFVGNGAGLTGLSSGLWATQNTTDQSLAGGNVGIGTTITNAGAALTVMNGNVGIGSTNPTYALDVGGSFAVLNHLVNFTTPYSNTEMVFTPQSTHQSAEIGLNDDANQGWILASNGSSNTIGSGVFIILDPSNTKAPIAINANDQVMIGGTNSSLMSSQIVSSTAAFQVLGTSDFNGNVGIGTSFTNTGTALQVMSGNMGIGTWRASGVLDVEGSLYPTIFYGRGTVENVGIGSLTPGQALDVSGTVRATGFVGNGSLLTNIVGLTQWTTSNTNDVYLPNHGNVGIGTSFTNTGAALTVMNGNVGIGTWVPASKLEVNGNVRISGSGHLISVGTAPTVANNDCGSTVQGAVTSKSTDVSGSLTAGTVAVSSCAITFNASWTNAPNCVVVDDTNVLALKASTTTTKLTIIATGTMDSDTIAWICVGNE